jgi:hypothetical protein
MLHFTTFLCDKLFFAIFVALYCETCTFMQYIGILLNLELSIIINTATSLYVDNEEELQAPSRTWSL